MIKWKIFAGYIITGVILILIPLFIAMFLSFASTHGMGGSFTWTNFFFYLAGGKVILLMVVHGALIIAGACLFSLGLIYYIKNRNRVKIEDQNH